MRFAVHCLDMADSVSLRLEHYEAHKAYIAASPVATVISGPLLADDNETMIGSLFILEASSEEDVEAFNRGDPFARAGVWAQVHIHSFLMRVDNRT